MDTPVETDVCQQRCLHPEHALAVRRHLLATASARSVADLFAVLSEIGEAVLHPERNLVCL